MNSYRITYGLGGGYNSKTEEVIEADSQGQAMSIAYELALEEFESQGVFEEQMSEDEQEEYNDLDSEEQNIMYNEEAERWIDYFAVEI